MIKAIGIDLDGTLLSDDKTICPANLDAVKRARDKGIFIILCSGRSRDGMRRELDALNLLREGNYAVGLNGGVAFETASGHLLFRKLMKPECARFAIRRGRELKDYLNAQLYDGERVYVERYDDTTRVYSQVTGSEVTLVDDLEAYADQAVKVGFFSENFMKASMDEIVGLKAKLEEGMPGGMQAAISAPYLAEVFDQNTNKGAGIEALGNLLGFSAEEMMGIGDLENDRGLLLTCKTAVLMKNGTPSLRDIATYITQKDNNEGGVAEAIEKFALSS